jgi:hypothetical protein
VLRTIVEADWKVLRRLHPLALERFCERVLAEIDPVIQVRAQSAHQRYLGIFKIIEQRDREMASIFDDPKRSNALRMLAKIQSIRDDNAQINIFRDSLGEAMCFGHRRAAAQNELCLVALIQDRLGEDREHFGNEKIFFELRGGYARGVFGEEGVNQLGLRLLLLATHLVAGSVANTHFYVRLSACILLNLC